MAENAHAAPFDLARTQPSGEPGSASLVDRRLGRYIVLDVLGTGGMGVVYAAYDPLLDRKIALKLLLEPDDDSVSSGTARMHREAQALARLSHPNVIAIHDVGDYGRGMYLAMELVQGKTLRDWQAGRPWREVLDAYIAAARGLAAAHAAGLVHRDFKPENVLVGDDGRVRVTDFGLARLTGSAPPPPEPAATASPSQLTTNLTAAGAVIGTLSYMAPEQIDGGSVDERSDQCSWCIAAWEALYSAQPFISGPAMVRSAAMKTDSPAPPHKTAVPRAIERILARGLLPEPAARWPSMRTLADELARATSSRRRIAGFVAIGAVAVAVMFFAGRHSGARELDCSRAGAPIDEVWTPWARAGVARAFAATQAPFAAGALASVERTVTAFRDRWHHLAVDSCVATHVQGAQSARVLDLRTACLGRARDRLAVTLGALSHADRKVVEQAPLLTPPDLDACSDVAALEGKPPPPLATAAGRRAIEATLEPLERELDAGVALDRATSLEAELAARVTAAQSLGWPPLVSRAQRALALAQIEQGHGVPARVTLLAAAAAASAAGDADTLIELYIALAGVEARLTSDFALGERWAELAWGTLTRLGPRPTKQIAVAEARGYLAERAGRPNDARPAYTDALARAQALGPVAELSALIDLARVETMVSEIAPARAHLERARELAIRELGAAHPQVALVEHNLGTVEFRAGNYARARGNFETALGIRRAVYGDDSVEVAGTLEARSNADVALDRTDDARKGFEQAIRVFEARLGPDHPDVANAYNSLGATLHRMGLYEAALANAQRVLAMREKALGPTHPDVAQSLVNLAIEAKNLRRWELVDASYPRARAIFEKAYGKDALEIAALEINLGEACRARGKFDAAVVAYSNARDLMTPQLGESHPMLAHVWNGLGQVELAQQRVEQARPFLERAVTMRERDPGDATDLAESRFALARSLPRAEHSRATELATAARDAYQAAGAGYAERLAAVEAWLAR